VPSAPPSSPAWPMAILPCISGCSSQWYVTAPDPSKRTSKEYPGSNTLVSNNPLSAVAVCDSVSLLRNLTVVPGATLSWVGSKPWLLISTVIVLFGAGVLLAQLWLSGQVWLLAQLWSQLWLLAQVWLFQQVSLLAQLLNFAHLLYFGSALGPPGRSGLRQWQRTPAQP
jgi:hypothetical protein